MYDIPSIYHKGNYFTSYGGKKGGNVVVVREQDHEIERECDEKVNERMPSRYVQVLNMIIPGNVQIYHVFVECAGMEAIFIRKNEKTCRLSISGRASEEGKYYQQECA